MFKLSLFSQLVILDYLRAWLDWLLLTIDDDSCHLHDECNQAQNVEWLAKEDNVEEHTPQNGSHIWQIEQRSTRPIDKERYDGVACEVNDRHPNEVEYDTLPIVIIHFLEFLEFTSDACIDEGHQHTKKANEPQEVKHIFCLLDEHLLQDILQGI